MILIHSATSLLAASMSHRSPELSASATPPPPHSLAHSPHAHSHSHQHPRVRAVRAALHLSRNRAHTPDPGLAYDATAAAAASPVVAAPSGAQQDGHAAAASVKPPWRRILYEPQPYPDSYTDPSLFLGSLVTNANVVPLSYPRLCLAACSITQRLSLLALWAASFHAMRHGAVATTSVLAGNFTALAAGMGAMVAMRARQQGCDSGEWIGFAVSSSLRVLLLTLLLLFVSPLLLTLTLSYSSDTIWALSATLAGVHVLAFDYRWINEAQEGKKDFQGALSLNAGIFAALLLGSRFQSDAASPPSADSALSSHAAYGSSAPVQCFAFVLCSFMVFGGCSVAAMWARRMGPRCHVGLTLALLGAASAALGWLSQPQHCAEPLPWTVMPVLLLACASVNLLAPAWLIRAQQYKNEIHGPWDYDDEAELESDNM